MLRIRRIFRMAEEGTPWDGHFDNPNENDDADAEPPRFRFNRDPEYMNDVNFMDDEEQEELIESLRQEDIAKNEYFAKSFFVISLMPLPFFLIRLSIKPNLVDLLSIVSLLLSFISVPSPLTTDVSILPTSKLQRYGLRINLWLVFIISLMVWGAGWREQSVISLKRGYWAGDSEHLGYIPAVVWSMTLVAKRFMEEVNLGELENLRYQYIGA